MRKIVASINVTLDGFMADTDGKLDWHFAYWDDEMCNALCKQLYQADTLLLGGNTYRALAAYWPHAGNSISIAKEDIVMAELMNSLNKIVVSNTILNGAWQNTASLKGNLVKGVRALKMLMGKDIILLGSIKLLRALIRLGLIDRYELWVHPVTIGKGKAMFGAPAQKLRLRLTQVKHFHSGVIHLSYEYDRKAYH